MELVHNKSIISFTFFCIYDCYAISISMSRASNKILPSIEAKTIHYLSNGSGRDNYINANNGGIQRSPVEPVTGYEIGTSFATMR